MDRNSLSHVVWDCKYHIVLVPKYRYKVFEKEIKEAVRDELKKLCLWLRIAIVEGHVTKDHVHICVAIPPKLTVAEVVGTLKGKTANRDVQQVSRSQEKVLGKSFLEPGILRKHSRQ